MAHVKNTDRRKRKYANQAGRTAKNKEARQRRHERREARFAERTEALMGKRIRYASERTATVTDILYPEPKDKGPKRVLVLVDEKDGTEVERLRKAVKPL